MLCSGVQESTFTNRYCRVGVSTPVLFLSRPQTPTRMSFLLFVGLLIATALIALNTLDNIKDMLKPQPVRVPNR